jgi:hypothetical protein
MNFTDDQGAAAIPLTVNYSLVNLADNTMIVDHASAGTPAASMRVMIKASENEIATLPTSTARPTSEKRRFLVHAVFDVDDELWEYIDYEVHGVEGQVIGN